MQTMLVPYLNFNGNAREAMMFYQSILGGKLDIQSFADAKMAEKPEDADRTMHAHLASDAITIMASDGRPGTEVVFGDSVHLSLNGSDEATLTEWFDKLASGGTVTMPLAKQFWGDTFGMLTDKFGMHWMMNISGKK